MGSTAVADPGAAAPPARPQPPGRAERKRQRKAAAAAVLPSERGSVAATPVVSAAEVVAAAAAPHKDGETLVCPGGGVEATAAVITSAIVPPVVLMLPADAERATEGGGYEEEPGGLLRLGLEEMMALIERDLLVAIQASAGYALDPACEPSASLVANYEAAVRDHGAKGCWEQIMCWRVQDSWRTRRSGLIWLDDKVSQIGITAALSAEGRELHLPLLAHAVSGDAASEDRLREAARKSVVRGDQVVVKPRHGANSRHVYLWPEPHAVGVNDVLASVDAALGAQHHSWNSECWQLSQVPKGALLQPMYAMGFEKGDAPKSSAAPLELKVQVLFAEVVGATLNTHPQALFVTRGGVVQVWDTEDLKDIGVFRCRKLDQRYGHYLPEGLLEMLQRVLCADWHFIRSASESLARAAGLDELRVDWLLGDERWGSRIGELTYMGAGSRLLKPLSVRFARAFAAAHLRRLGRLVLLRADSDERDGAEGGQQCSGEKCSSALPCGLSLWPLHLDRTGYVPKRGAMIS